jgi:hypothetical protein
MSFYVKRSTLDGKFGWTGPIRSRARADREAAAWVDCGRKAEVVPSTPEVRAEVRAWVKAKRR